MLMERRNFLGSACKLAAMATLPGTVSASAFAGSNENATSRTLKTFRRIAYAEDNFPTIWWKHGNKFGVLEGEVSHLWDIGTIIISKGALDPEGIFRARILEIFFQFAPGTDEILKQWTNPYTGSEIELPIFKASPFTSQYPDVKFSKSQATPIGDMKQEKTIYEPRKIGGMVWLDLKQEIALTAEAGDRGAMTTRITEYVSYSADENDLEEGVGYLRARCDLDIWADWSPRLDMAGFSGGMLTRAQGQKVQSLNQLPDRIKAALQSYYPDVFERGTAVLDL